MTSVGLVLGGGGLAGFAYHTGTLAALQRLTGWDPRTAEIMVGTSAGSGIAALLRGGVSASESLDRMLAVPTNPRSMARLRELGGRELGQTPRLRFAPAAPKLAIREVLRGPFVRPSRIVAGLLPSGSVRTDMVGDRAAELLGDEWPDEELWITAIRLSDGELVVFGKERTDVSVAAATEASSAIPGYFRPVVIHGERYVDGGVHSATNADQLVGRELDLVVIVSPMSGGSVRDMTRTISGPMRLWCKATLKKEVRALRENGTEVLVLEPTLDEMRAMGPTLMDPTRVVNTVLQTSSLAMQTLSDERIADRLDVLRAAAAEHPSPANVPYPD